MSELVVIPARQGGATRMKAGEAIRIVNSEGGQVSDFWAFREGDPGEHMSMPHSVVTLGRIKPAPGDVLVSNLRRPLMELLSDTSPGVHCMLFAACDVARYELLGFKGRHDNCADNLRRAAEPFGIPLPYIPTPLNLFMNTKFHDHRVMTVEPPPAQPGDAVTFRALADCVVVLSSCPQDLVPVNGHGCTPKPVGYEILPLGERK